MKLRYLLAATVGLFSQAARTQSVQKVSAYSYQLELGGVVATSSQTPFWLRTNQYGIIPLESKFGTARMGMSRQYRTDTTLKSAFDWGFGVNGVFNVTENNNKIWWPDLYVKVKLGPFELSGGNRREIFGLGDSTLTSGFVAWSGNAMPFPKIQLQTIDYVPLKFLKSILSFKASYAHGWFTVPYIQGAYLHQKTIYLRFGKPHWALRFYAGLNHQVQWGGKADYLKGTLLAQNGQLPSTFRDYISLITGRYPDDLSNDRYTVFDGTNRIGNHLGSYDFALEWQQKSYRFLLYHQHIYEDASGLAFQNFPDGLTGISISRKKNTKENILSINKLTIEYLSTLNQSGAVFDPSAQYQGTDNYFNHGQYIEGWSYLKHTLGTPFIAPGSTLKTEVQDRFKGFFFPNNQLKVWYVGSAWTLGNNVNITTRSSFSQNFGSFSYIYTPALQQFSHLLSAQIILPKVKGLTLIGSAALDHGALFPQTFGGYVGVKKRW
ncbi:capsule assembly Wzi family protein [Runella sp.]|uniref:capsule assembly Wzi family protein n=1 Tax=Runella sp. TaxID=1960881 RepID=UPI003D0CA493